MTMQICKYPLHRMRVQAMQQIRKMDQMKQQQIVNKWDPALDILFYIYIYTYYGLSYVPPNSYVEALLPPPQYDCFIR